MSTQQSMVKAVLWMAGSIVSFLTMSIAGKELTPYLNVFQVLEMRSVIGLVMLLPLVWLAGGFSAMRSPRPMMHVGRNLVHYAGQFAWLYALTLIPLAELISIEFTMPFWAAILAVIFLGEKMTLPKAAAIGLGLIGVAIIVRPDANGIETGHLIMLACAMAFAVSVVMVKSMTRTENTVRIIFWMLVIQSGLGLIPAISVWKTPSADLWPWILLIAFTGTFSHYCLTRALAHADTLVVMPIDFLRVPLSALIGWALYNEGVDKWIVIGAALILVGNLLNLQRRATKPLPVEMP